MRKIYIAALLLIIIAGTAVTTHAQTTSLDGLWEFRFDKDARLESLIGSDGKIIPAPALMAATADRQTATTASLPAADGQTATSLVTPDFAATDMMTVPGCWDVMPQYLKQRGTAQYRREIILEHDVLNAWWRIEGMGLRSEYYVDGRKVGSCQLPYSSFEIETGPLSAGKHILTAAVDNCFDEDNMKMFRPYYDFYAFGGFYHGMSLTVQTTKTQLHRLQVRTIDYKSGEIEVELLFRGQEAPARFSAAVSIDGAPAQKMTVTARPAETRPAEARPAEATPAGSASATDQTQPATSGRQTKAPTGTSPASAHPAEATHRIRLTVPDPTAWSPDAPHMHSVSITALGSTAEARFGLRKIEARDGRLFLNDQPLYLRGVNRHESHPTFGSATPESLMMLDLHNLRSIGANFLRGCHYPQSQRFLDLCDEMGVLVWEESLGWGNTVPQLSDPEFMALQREQAELTVRESFNHPSVIIWGYLNEFASQTAEGKTLSDQIIGIIRAQDSGRLISFACNHGLQDIALENCDIVSLNTYPGWIGTEPGTTEQLRQRIGECVDGLVAGFRERYPDKPVIFSEMGTCGVYGYRDPAAAQWTEEFQVEYVGDVLDAIMTNPETSGIAIWQFCDAPSYHRDGATVRSKPFATNLAGLYDQYRRPKLVTDTVRSHYTR